MMMFNPFTSRAKCGSALESFDEIHTIQMKTIQEYFPMALYIFKYFKMYFITFVSQMLTFALILW